MSLSDQLYQLRKSQNITLQTLSLKTDISMASLSAYERGKYKPSLENLCRLAAFYEMTLDELLSSSAILFPQKHHTKQLTSGDIPNVP